MNKESSEVLPPIQRRKQQQDYEAVRDIEMNVQNGDKTGHFHSQKREDNRNEPHWRGFVYPQTGSVLGLLRLSIRTASSVVN